MSSVAEVIRLVNICVGIPVFVCGVTGNFLNIRLFWRTRRNPCAFIFMALSVINCVALFYGLFTRIASTGFGLDWSSTNLIWCKTRSAFATASFLMSVTCVCLASIDRFLASCREEKYRRWSRLSVARWSVLSTILVWMAHAVPDLIYGQLIQNPVTGVTSCSSTSPPSFTSYRAYVSLPFYIGVIPAIILTVTGLLTRRNTSVLQQERQRQAIQRQLTTMMLIQIPIILGSTMPYIIFTEYQIFSATMVKSTSQRALESILSNVLTLFFYTSFATAFFVFFFSSTTFRDDTKRLLFCQRIDLTVARTTQVQPLSMTMHKTTRA